MNLSPSDFQYVSALVRRESAIVLEPGKEYLVEARLMPLARAAGAASVAEFVASVRQRPGSPEHASIVDAMTTNETSWFRDREPFSALTSTVLPEVLARRGATGTLRVWSAACSSGQEPYTLAMVLREALPAAWNYEIIGTDISAEMVARAEAGQFSQLEMNRGLPVPMLVRWFTKSGTGWRVNDELRRGISFRRMNLAVPFPALPRFDVIFLRNVLIYFDMQTKAEILGRMRSTMAPDGWLFLGAAETTMGVRDDFERVPVGRSSAYRLRVAAIPHQRAPERLAR